MLLESSPNLHSLYTIDVERIFPNTGTVVEKHCHEYSKFYQHNNIANHTIEAFRITESFVNRFYSNQKDQSDNIEKRVIIDSGIGTGTSSLYLARKNLNLPVIGIDKSICRLSKNKYFRPNDDSESVSDSVFINEQYDNLLLIRADLVDFWTLVALQSGYKSIFNPHFYSYDIFRQIG